MASFFTSNAIVSPVAAPAVEPERTIPELHVRRPFESPNARYSPTTATYKHPVKQDLNTKTYTITIAAPFPVPFKNKDPIPFMVDTRQMTPKDPKTKHTVVAINIVKTSGILQHLYRADAYTTPTLPKDFASLQRLVPINTAPSALSPNHTLGMCAAVISFGSNDTHCLLKEQLSKASTPAPTATTAASTSSISLQDRFINVSEDQISPAHPYIFEKNTVPHTRVQITLPISDSEWLTNPVAWMLGTKMIEIAAAHKEDKDAIVFYQNHLLVREHIYTKYLEETKSLIESANRTISETLCIMCAPDTSTVCLPTMIATYNISPAEAERLTATAEHRPTITIVIEIQEYTNSFTVYQVNLPSAVAATY